MKYYNSAEEVQAAYLAEALSSECPKTGYFEGGKLLATSTSDKPFFYAKNCPTSVRAKVANTYIKDGKVKDEAPIQIISGTPEGFLDGVEKVFAFTTPGLGDDNLKVTVIEKGVIWSECEFPAGHNFAVKAEAITVNMYRSVIDRELYEEAQLPEQDQDKCLAKYTAEVKAERNARISDTDSYIQVSDMTVQSVAKAKRTALTDDQKEAIKTYRQALRDLPEAQGFPFVGFPALPECIAYEAQQKIDSRNAQMNQGGF